MSAVKRNIVANYLGSAWSALMGLAFIPLYIRYLGMEAYALIGVFALLQAWLALLDAGLTPTLNREVARSLAKTHTAQSIHDLLRSVEWIYAIVAIAIALGLITMAPWLATSWLHAEHLSTATVIDALTITGGVVALRWMSAPYRGAIMGLQQQVWLSGCGAFFSTLRGLGVVAVLAWVSPTIQAFFIYQGVLAALEALVLAVQTRRLLPKPSVPAHFRWQALLTVWRFATGMAAITMLAILLTQVDKLILSNLLPLTQFGYYALASTMVGVLYTVVTPINNVAYPRLTELVARKELPALIDAYHKFSQAMTLMVVPAALVLCLFSDHVLLLWTRDAQITAAVSPLVSLLVIGSMFNGLMHIPYALQLAYGWTRFAIITNAIAVLVFVPALYAGVSTYGAIGAAIIWVMLNVGYVGLALPFMHRKLLPTEIWLWYRQDTLLPAFAALIATGLVKRIAPTSSLDKPWESVAALTVASILAVAAAALATPLGRMQLRRFVRPAG